MLFAGIFQNTLYGPPNTHDNEEGSREGMTFEAPHVQLGVFTPHYFSHFASVKSDSSWAFVVADARAP